MFGSGLFVGDKTIEVHKPSMRSWLSRYPLQQSLGDIELREQMFVAVMGQPHHGQKCQFSAAVKSIRDNQEHTEGASLTAPTD